MGQTSILTSSCSIARCRVKSSPPKTWPHKKSMTQLCRATVNTKMAKRINRSPSVATRSIHLPPQVPCEKLTRQLSLNCHKDRMDRICPQELRNHQLKLAAVSRSLRKLSSSTVSRAFNRTCKTKRATSISRLGVVS